MAKGVLLKPNRIENFQKPTPMKKFLTKNFMDRGLSQIHIESLIKLDFVTI